MQSILQPDGVKECFLTGATDILEKHHIYPGGLRGISEVNGFWVWLRYDQHREVQQSADTGKDLYLRRTCQREYEKTHTRDEFIALIGRSYL